MSVDCKCAINVTLCLQRTNNQFNRFNCDINLYLLPSRKQTLKYNSSSLHIIYGRYMCYMYLVNLIKGSR